MRIADAYRAGTVALAAGALALSLPAAPPPAAGWGTALLLVALAVAAIQFPLVLAPSDKLSASTAAFFCIVLMYPTALAACLVAAAQLLGAGVSLARHALQTRSLPDWRVVPLSVGFNASQLALAALAAGWCRDALGAGIPPEPAAAATYAGAILAAIAFYTINCLAVSIAIGLATGRGPLWIFLSGTQVSGLQFAALYATGFLAALAASHWWWVLPGMAFPAAAAILTLHRRISALQRAFEAVQAIADMVDRRDRYTADHSKRVAVYAVRIARALRVPESDVRVLESAARVHDVGKILTPDAILHKAGRLSEEERIQMEHHPVDGYEILKRYSAYERGRHLVLCHHERYDGRGYPNGVRGSHLPLLAQIMPVADSFDAMTSDRPYRPAMTVERALGILAAGRGTQWNPDVVDAAMRALAPIPVESAVGMGRALTC